MIVCKECNFEMLKIQDTCPRCGKTVKFSGSEIREIEMLYRMAEQNKEYEAVAEYLRMLAESGNTDYERQYGISLEKGEIVERDYARAMEYFLRAAKKNDPYSAYRYSRLVSRLNERAGRFWLVFSALLSCVEAYPHAAREMSRSKNEDAANHFYILAATHDDVDSIVEIAARYFKGEHIAHSPESAKWYMDKLNFPPLYALKLAYKLRGVSAREPGEYIFDKNALVHSMAEEAARCGFAEAYYKLNTMLAEAQDLDAMTLVAILLANGEGCEKNIDEAVRIFTESAARGSAEAYLCLGKIYLEGTVGEEYKDAELAVRYFNEAAKHGSFEAYDILGDIYESGNGVQRDYKKAEEYYRRAANGGVAESLIKAEKIVGEREKIYKKAIAMSIDNPESAFRGLAIAAAMGQRSAPLKLANCYLKGLGVKQDNSAAYYWYRTAAEAMDEKALYPLGLCLAGGIGVNRDYKSAIKVFKKAASFGSDGAKLQIKNLLEAKKKKLTRRLYSASMRLIYLKKYSEARDMLELAARLGEKKAYYTIGCMYEFGLGSPSDRYFANKFYEKSMEAGYFDDRSKYKKAILKLIRK